MFPNKFEHLYLHRVFWPKLLKYNGHANGVVNVVTNFRTKYNKFSAPTHCSLLSNNNILLTEQKLLP
jgi:hypothetical protein